MMTGSYYPYNRFGSNSRVVFWAYAVITRCFVLIIIRHKSRACLSPDVEDAVDGDLKMLFSR